MFFLFFINFVCSLRKYTKQEKDDMLNKIKKEIEEINIEKIKILDFQITKRKELIKLSEEIDKITKIKNEADEELKSLKEFKNSSIENTDRYNILQANMEKSDNLIGKLQNQIDEIEKDMIEYDALMATYNDIIKELEARKITVVRFSDNS